jgi:hypothetical protein
LRSRSLVAVRRRQSRRHVAERRVRAPVIEVAGPSGEFCPHVLGIISANKRNVIVGGLLECRRSAEPDAVKTCGEASGMKFARPAVRFFAALASVCLLAGFAPNGRADTQPQRIFILQPYDHRLPATILVADALRKRLRATSPTTEIFEDFLDLARFPSESDKDRVAHFLAAKYAGSKIQVIFAPGVESLSFARDHSAEIALEARVIFCCVPPESLAEPRAVGSGTWSSSASDQHEGGQRYETGWRRLRALNHRGRRAPATGLP